MNLRAREPSGNESGFTLIEIMLSMAIMASMMTLVFGAFSLGARGKQRAEAIADHYYQLRLVMNRMVREISMAYLSKNDQVGTVNPRTFFVSQRNSDVDELIFSYLGHMRMHENAKESDQAVVRYYTAPNPRDRSRSQLMRRETRRLGMEQPEEDGPAYVMLDDVEELHFEFFDEQANEWRDTWNTKSADGEIDRLPLKVRIKLTVKDEQDKPVTLTTATRIFLRDPLWFAPK